MVPSYDPELNLVYVGTSVTSPAPKFMIAGNDKTVPLPQLTLALNADTGEIVWYYQHIVDHWDLDHPFERLLVDTVVAPDRGEVTLDQSALKRRVSGERSSPGIPGQDRRGVYARSSDGRISLGASHRRSERASEDRRAHGRGHRESGATFVEMGQTRLDLSLTLRRQELAVGNYSPLGNVMFFPAAEHLHDVNGYLEPARASTRSTALHEQPSIAPEPTTSAPSGDFRRDGETPGSTSNGPACSRCSSTAGGFIFGGDANGRFRAFDQQTGKVLWEMNLGAPVSGYSVSFADRQPAIHRSEHGLVVDCHGCEPIDARAPRESRQQPVRVRVALRRRPRATRGAT